MDLIIVESPSKAKTIAKYLKGKYKVDASGGHVRDLPEKRLGVDIEKNFEPTYVITPEKSRSSSASRKKRARRTTSISRPTRTARARPFPGT